MSVSMLRELKTVDSLAAVYIHMHRRLAPLQEPNGNGNSRKKENERLKANEKK
jgi:hypothetical protein